MNPLRELQLAFKAHVLRGDAAIVDAIASTGRDDAGERLGIYAHAYRERLRGVLREEFIGLRALAGSDGFDALMDGYIDAHPSRHPNIRWFGANMADWLVDAPHAGPRPEYAAMARLDWALSTAFDAASTQSIGAGELAALTASQWPSLRLRVGDNVQRLPLEWNVDEFRLAIDSGSEPPPVPRSAPRVVAVWRKDFSVRHRRLDEDEAALLDAATRGSSFGELCELLCGWHAVDAVAPRAVHLLQRWIAAGWIGGMEVQGSGNPG